MIMMIMLQIFTAETRKTQRTAKKYLIPMAIRIFAFLRVLASPMFVATKARRHEVFKYEAPKNAFNVLVSCGERNAKKCI
jgi:hypothetical protein